MLTLRQNEIGGGRVRRGFWMGTPPKYVLAGTEFTREQLLKGFRPLNLQALMEQGAIRCWPLSKGAADSKASPGCDPAASGDAEPAERFSFHEGFGKYSVIEGRKLNPEPLTKEQAMALVMAGRSPPH